MKAGQFSMFIVVTLFGVFSFCYLFCKQRTTKMNLNALYKLTNYHNQLIIRNSKRHKRKHHLSAANAS